MNRTATEVWALDPSITYLNHAAFGATPATVLEYQTELCREMEKDPSEFLHFRLPNLLDNARRYVAEFLEANPDGFVFTRNATEGLNTILRSLVLRPGDELLITDHSHQVSVAVARTVASMSRAEVTVVRLPELPSSA